MVLNSFHKFGVSCIIQFCFGCIFYDVIIVTLCKQTDICKCTIHDVCKSKFVSKIYKFSIELIYLSRSNFLLLDGSSNSIFQSYFVVVVLCLVHASCCVFNYFFLFSPVLNLSVYLVCLLDVLYMKFSLF